MVDLGSEILRRYGSGAIFLMIFFAAVVWAFAHFAAAPGKPVKVLWGLVEYTKAVDVSTPSRASNNLIPPTVNAPTVQPDKTEDSTSQSSLSPLNLSITHGLSSETYEEQLANLRLEYSLRQLRPIESDRPINASPPDTYFYIFSTFLRLDSSASASMLLELSATRLRKRRDYDFEVHHRSLRNVVLITYASESDADRIRRLTGADTFQVTLAPHPWGQFSSLVELPILRIVSSQARALDIDDVRRLAVLDIEIR